MVLLLRHRLLLASLLSTISTKDISSKPSLPINNYIGLIKIKSLA